MSESPKSVFMLYSVDEGCRMHRILSPARFLKRDIQGVKFAASGRGDEYAAEHDYYVVHGLPVADTLTKMLRHKIKGRTFVWSIDDDYMNIPPWNPCRMSPERLEPWNDARTVADWVIVSTDGLAATFDDTPDRDKVLVAPNLVDLGLYPTPTPAPKPGADRAFTVLWAGSNTHLYDVKPVVAAVAHCLKKYEGKVPLEFVFFGQAPPSELLTDHLHKGVVWQPPVELSQYWGVLNQIRPHVVLAPLFDCKFNLSKSNIRVLDGWALSAAVVASPVGEYKVVEHGIDGLAAADDGDWIAALERLIEDHAFRERIAVAGRRRCEREWDWQNPACRRPWVEVFHRILDRELVPA